MIGLTVPDEVRALVDLRFGSSLFEPNREPDFTRLVFAPKVTSTKDETWRRACRSGIAGPCRESTGWRKCHTNKFWAYYALPDPRDTLAARQTPAS